MPHVPQWKTGTAKHIYQKNSLPKKLAEGLLKKPRRVRRVSGEKIKSFFAAAHPPEFRPRLPKKYF